MGVARADELGYLKGVGEKGRGIRGRGTDENPKEGKAKKEGIVIYATMTLKK